MAKPKFYVVWQGRALGVFDRWKDCQQQTNGFPQARFKAFKTRAEAVHAFEFGWEKFYGKSAPPTVVKTIRAANTATNIGTEPVLDSICVDAAWNTQTGVVEYRGLETLSGKEIFRMGSFEDGTINVGEFLALVHGLAWCKQHDRNVPVCSDSYNAIKWVKQKKVNTHLQPSEKTSYCLNSSIARSPGCSATPTMN